MNHQENKTKQILFWIDCEMTGLDATTDTLLEVGIKLTDMAGNFLRTGPCYVIHHTKERLEAMNDWCLQTHAKNGLIEASLLSSMDVHQAETGLMAFVEEYASSEPRYMAGSSIWCDRVFLHKYMPRFVQLFHYRLLDVSSLKIIFQKHFEKPYVHLMNKDRHRVMEDIDNSIQEYRYYLECMRV